MILLNEFTHTKDLGFPAEDLLVKESKSLKNCILIPFLTDLDEKECMSLQFEEYKYGQANHLWKEINDPLSRVTITALGAMFTGTILGLGAKSKFSQILYGCTLFASSTVMLGSMICSTHYALSTGFKETAKQRINRLNEKIIIIHERILSLDNSKENIEELNQLNKAFEHFTEIKNQWNGRVIKDARLGLGTKLIVKFD